MEENKNWWNWLAIASFVLALVWSFLCLIWCLTSITIIGIFLWIFCLPLWILCLILALIFGIIALCKKQTVRASIIWLIFSLIWLAVPVIFWIFIWRFVIDHKDQLMSPLTEFAARVQENPNIATMMNDEEFSNKFWEALEQRLQEKYGEEYSEINNIDWIMNILGDVFEEMTNVATELAEQEWATALVPVESEETPAEATVCDDFYKSGEEIVCTEQYEPVCGDNGQTYGNSCFACIEVNSYTDWECTEAAPAPAAKLMVQEWQTEEETQAMIQETCTNAWGQLVDGNCVLEDGSVIAF